MLQAWDHRLFLALYAGSDPRGILPLVMMAFSVIGSGWSLFALAPLLVVQRTRRFAAHLLGSCVACAIAVFTIKKMVDRVRPSFALTDVHPLFGTPTDPSFPSGHAAGGFCVALFVTTLCLSAGPRTAGRKFVALAFLVTAALIALSRVYLGAHFPGDVTAGALLGSALGYVGARVFLPDFSKPQHQKS